MDLLNKKKIKVIDLLKDFADGKDFDDIQIKYDEFCEFEYFNIYELFDKLSDDDLFLNDEVEIKEEKTINDTREEYGLPRIERKKVDPLDPLSV